jgi:hypothetical protein
MQTQSQRASDPRPSASSVSEHRLPAIGGLPHLSRAEWDTVSTAFNDAWTGACRANEPSALRRFGRKLLALTTGIRTPPPLADDRLDTLRRFLCTTRTTGNPSSRLWSELLEQGYSEAQVEALALLALEERS